MNRTKVLELCASTREGLISLHRSLHALPNIADCNFKLLADEAWGCLERVREIAQEVGTGGDPFRTPAGEDEKLLRPPWRDPRNFRQCIKCLNWPGVNHIEAVYVTKDSTGLQKGAEAVSSWPYQPGVALADMADEGFYVRCTGCSYAWYEPMEDTGV